MEARFQLTPGFFLWGALCLLLLPFPWLIGVLTAATLHEVFHCLAVWLCGGQVLGLTLGAGGAKIETAPMPPWKVLLCALAGPLGSFCLLPLSQYFPEAAVCGMIQGVYNLIPIFPLDGGRALRVLLPIPVCIGVEAFVLTLLTGLSLALAFSQRDFGLILLLSLWFPVIQRKFSCKEGKLAVQ